MKPKRIVRSKEAWKILGCGHSAFEDRYRWHTDDDPFVPGTDIPRIKSIPLGSRNVGFLECELDELIEALARLRDVPSPTAKARRAYAQNEEAPG
jgi:predicted DNA-binding transcriptional regulator AlpA